MSTLNEPQPVESLHRHPRGLPTDDEVGEVEPDGEQVLELREEQLIAHKELRDAGEVQVRTEVEDVPARLEVDAYREEIEVEHEPVGQAVSERQDPWEADGVLIVPVYEEQLVVTKRLILRERLHVRRVGTTERKLFQDTVRRERLIVEDPQQAGYVHEVYPTEEPHPTEASPVSTNADADTKEQSDGGLLEHLVRKALE